MKGIFIAYDQAYNMEIADALETMGVRGFTMWQDIAGRGSYSGEPHLGNHAWPTMNNAILTFCLLYTSPSPRDGLLSRMPSSA